MTVSDVIETTDETQLRERALKRLKNRRDFHTHLVVYTLVNGFILAIWAMTSAGFFWPIFPIVGWGIGLVMNGWEVYRGDDFDEDAIRREMSRLRAHG